MNLRSLLIRSRYQKWLLPSLFALPYTLSLCWLVAKGLFWVVQIMLAPLLMTGLLLVLTFVLAKLEFRR